MLLKTCLLIVPVCFVVFPLSVEGANAKENWTEFRNGGSSSVTSQLPHEWTPKRGLAWQKELIGYGQSTPVIHQGQLFVSSVVGPSKDECCVMCFDLQSGAEQWNYQLKSATQAPSNYMQSRAAPTPTVDEQGVYAFFEGGDLVALTKDGKRRWHRNLATELGPFKNRHGLGSSPTQTDELVILNLEHDGPSVLVAFDKQNGKTKWKVDRPSGSSWTSPIVVDGQDTSLVVVSSAKAVTAYDATSGDQVWQLEGLEGNSVPSPTCHGKHLLIGARLPEFGSSSNAANSNLCLQLSGTDHDVLWRSKTVICDYASPVVAGNYAYFLNKVGVLTCVDVESGKQYYRKRIGIECWSTPLVSNDHVYFFGKNGETLVLKPGESFQKVALNNLWNVDDPPKPETYVESQGAGHGHGKPSSQSSDSSKSKSGKPSSRRRGGMFGKLKASDTNGDGLLTKEEVPEAFVPFFARIDANKDGQVDESELKVAEESFRKRRENSREGARDPIVYGVAAADGLIVIRTGTRLFAVAARTDVTDEAVDKRVSSAGEER